SRSGLGEADDEPAADAGRPLGLRRAPEIAGDPMHDRQAEADTGSAPEPGAGGSIERVEDVRLLVGPEADPPVRDRELDHTPRPAEADDDRRARFAVLGGVLEQ